MTSAAAPEMEFGNGEQMAPWDQHSAVISIPRFNYAAPYSLLERSHAGFLITCPIKREKSATKEAITIFEKHMNMVNSDPSISSGCHPINVCSKKQRLSSSESEEEHGGNFRQGNGSDKLKERGHSCDEQSSERDKNAKTTTSLSLVKLIGSGLLLFTFPSNDFRVHWCNRIFPIQETCLLTEKNLKITVSKVVQEYVSSVPYKHEDICKFAASFNRRGMDEIKTNSGKASDSKELPLLDRGECFRVVGQAVKEVVKNSIVDLKSPEFVILIEALPLSGLPNGSVVTGVSVLPVDLVTTKPRLCVKPLISDPKAVSKRS